MKIWKPIKNGAEHEHYFVKFECRKKQYFRCLFTAEKKVAEKRANQLQKKARDGQFDVLDEAKARHTAKPGAVALGDVLKIYEEEIGARASIEPDTVRNNLATMRRVAREMFGLVDAERVEVSRLTGAAVRKWVDEKLAANRKAKKERKPEAKEEETLKATLNSTIRQAASVFSKQAMTLYKDRGLELPEMEGFKVKLSVDKDDTFVPFSPEALKALDEGIAELKGEDPQRWMIVMLARKLGLRSREIIHVRRGWFEKWPDGIRLAIIERPGEFKPKGRERRVPVPETLYNELMEVAGKDFLVDARHKTERYDFVARDTNAWLAGFMPDREKKLHELRKQAGSEHLMQHKDMTMTRDWLGHASITTTEKHYASLLVPIKPLM